MSLSTQEIELIESYRRDGLTDSKIERRTGIPLSKIREIPGTPVLETGRVLTSDRMGRHELREFILCTKDVNDVWPNLDPRIQDAKGRYDAGLCEICTGRDGDTLILYEIPRQRPVEGRHRYFAEECD